MEGISPDRAASLERATAALATVERALAGPKYDGPDRCPDVHKAVTPKETAVAQRDTFTRDEVMKLMNGVTDGLKAALSEYSLKVKARQDAAEARIAELEDMITRPHK